MISLKPAAQLREQQECANYFPLIASLSVLYTYCASHLGRLPCIRREIYTFITLPGPCPPREVRDTINAIKRFQLIYVTIPGTFASRRAH